MKIPITDKFLWDLHNFLEKVGDINDLISPRPWEEVWSFDLHEFRREQQKKWDKIRFNQIIYYLKKNNFIKCENLKNKQAVIFTKKGMDRVFKTKLKLENKKLRRDKKWQMIIFDIPEKKRKLRDLLRTHLQFLKYEILQKSIWVCPYDVLKETENFIQQNSLDQYVKLFLVKEIK